jgi:hypothetical protein
MAQLLSDTNHRLRMWFDYLVEPILMLQMLTVICFECACPSETGAIACVYIRYRYRQVRDLTTLT